MSMLLIAAASALSGAVPANIDVGQANWTNFPRLETENLAIPSGQMVGRVQRMLRGECEIDGQSARRFNIDINYAIALDPQGNATRILVQDVGCRPLELMVGRIASDIVARGFVRTAAPAETTIYANTINFNLR